MKLVERWGRQLRVRLARDWQLVPRGRHTGGAAAHVLIIASSPGPTLDYYLADLQAGARSVFDHELDSWRQAAAAALILPGTRVILVRMPDPRWASLLRAAEDRITEVVWLIDDDVPAAREDAWLPQDFRLRLLAKYVAFRRAFADIIDKVWASTPQIAAQFPEHHVELRPPRPLAKPELDASQLVTIFYHGTAAHRRELTFLLPILEQVQARCSNTLFEITGDHAVYRMFRGVPRLRVLHPMRWPDYLVNLRAANYDLGIVPLLDTPFNRARSGVKALELASIGVRGILSRRAPYVDYAHLPGMCLVGDSPSEWVDAIVRVAAEIVASRAT